MLTKQLRNKFHDGHELFGTYHQDHKPFVKQRKAVGHGIPNYPKGKFFKGYGFLKKGFESINGIAVYSSVEDESELYFLGIEDHKKNLGYGARLLKKVITDSKALGTKEIFIEVNEVNKVAIKLYVKCGFKKYGVRKNYYKNALNSFDDAVLMKLKLQS